jgi:hypothetical protein
VVEAEAIRLLKEERVDYTLDNNLPGNPVVAVTLRPRNVSEQLITTLERLPRLRSVRAYDNGDTLFRASELRSIARLRQLEKLTLVCTTVGTAELVAITKSCRLRWLTFDQCTFEENTSLTELAKLAQLKELSFNGCHNITDEVASGLQGAKGIEAILFSRCAITDSTVMKVATLPNLRRLEVHWIPITNASVKALARSQSLTELSLWVTKVGDEELDALARLPNLQKLDLSLSSVTDTGAAKLASSKSLSQLHLGYTSVGDEGIKSLASLKTLQILHLERTKTTDGAVSDLASLPNLRELSVVRTKLTELGLMKLKAALPNCNID